MNLSIKEEEIFIICKDFYNLYKRTQKKVDDFLFEQYGITEGLDNMYADFDNQYKKIKIKLDENSENSWTIEEFKEHKIKIELNKFWIDLKSKTKVSFLSYFATSSFKAEDTINNGFAQVFEKNDENESMADSINYFYMIFKLLHTEQDTGYNIFNKIIRHRISDKKNFKFLKFTNNTLTINSAISLAENQKNLQKKYRELELIKINEVKNMEELNQKLSTYLLLYQFRDKCDFAFKEIDKLLAGMNKNLLENIDNKGEYGGEDFYKKMYKRKILEIIKLVKE